MSVQSEITRIESAKTAIATAIEGKGVTVPEGTKLDGLAALVESIEASGGDFSALPQKIDTVLSGSVTPASDAEKNNDEKINAGRRWQVAGRK